MSREQFFVASSELVTDVISAWRIAGATFVKDVHAGQSGTLLTNPEADFADAPSLRFFVYELPPASIKLSLETVTTDEGELRTFVQQRYGSPYIDVHFIKPRKIEDAVVAGHGSLALYPFYYDIDTNEKIKPSDGLVGLFRSVSRHIRQRSNVERSPTFPRTFLVEKALHRLGAGPWFDYRIPPTTPAL